LGKGDVGTRLGSSDWTDVNGSRGGLVPGPRPTHHDVGVSVEEFDEFLQTPKAAFETAHEELCKLVLCRW